MLVGKKKKKKKNRRFGMFDTKTTRKKEERKKETLGPRATGLISLKLIHDVSRPSQKEEEKKDPRTTPRCKNMKTKIEGRRILKKK